MNGEEGINKSCLNNMDYSHSTREKLSKQTSVIAVKDRLYTELYDNRENKAMHYKLY